MLGGFNRRQLLSAWGGESFHRVYQRGEFLPGTCPRVLEEDIEGDELPNKLKQELVRFSKDVVALLAGCFRSSHLLGPRQGLTTLRVLRPCRVCDSYLHRPRFS